MNLHVTPNNLPRTDILISQRVPDDFNREQLEAKTALMAKIAVEGGAKADFIREKLQAFSPEERKKILDDLIARYEDKTNPSRDQAIADSIKKIKDKLINGEFHYPIGKPVANIRNPVENIRNPVENRCSSPTPETRQQPPEEWEQRAIVEGTIGVFVGQIAVTGGVAPDLLRDKLQPFSAEKRKEILDALIAVYEDPTSPARNPSIVDSIKMHMDDWIKGKFDYPIGKPSGRMITRC